MLKTQDLLTIALHEYEVLRAEMVNTVDRQYTIGNWAISSVAVMIAALAGGWGTLKTYPLFLIIAIYMAVPLLVTSHVLAWTHVISKISALGKRLHAIEGNVARLVGTEFLLEAYRIPPADSVNPFTFLLGWEHRLWHGQTNLRIAETTAMIAGSVAVVYLMAAIVGTLVWGRLDGLHLRPTAVVVGGIGVLYAVSWYGLYRYIRHLLS